MADTPTPDPDQIERLLSLVVDPVWYRARHRDVAESGVDPLRHFIESGLRERRDPSRWFDGAWYVRQNPDVAASGVHPLLHYMSEGAKQGRDPHPRFDARWYSARHPEAAGNPLLFHLRVGAQRGWLTERPVAIEQYLPSAKKPFADPVSVAVDIIIPVYRGLELTRTCIESVLADPARPPGRIIVIDDRSPEPKLSAWLKQMAGTGAVTLFRNKKNLGFVASANLGMRHAGDHDVVLLNNDTEVPAGWLSRLRAQAYGGEKVASVSPLSNNASICGYISYQGEPIPQGMTLTDLDFACRKVNAGRFAATPTTVGFCMYIRRAALDETGLFDVRTFGKGYGEENDFCLRASALGWHHRIACDTFVRHEGSGSFGDTAADAGISRAYEILTERYPGYAMRIAEFVDAGETEPFRFAVTMAMFNASGLPAILLVSHDMDGGVRRHVHDVIERDAGRANYLVLEPASRGIAMSVPALPGHPTLVLAAERWRDVAAVARSAGVTRVHIHHLMGLDLDIQGLINDLGVPFDVTVHDYFAICPQVTLLPWSAGPYCGEPGPDGCDACIANRPSHGATDILTWRLRWQWQFHLADRVFAPSQDALNRLRRYGLGGRASVVPHEPVPPGPWPLHHSPAGRRLRVALLGVLADHKGAQVVASVAMAADPARLELLLIGDVEASFPKAARDRMTIHGRYHEGELAGLLGQYRPHVIWFPASWPETYSFTLSAAIEAGLPIVASDIGAFPERLAGRPLTWLLPPTLDTDAWLALFDDVAAMSKKRRQRNDPVPMRAITALQPPPAATRRRGAKLLDLRADGVTSVLVVPEMFDDPGTNSYTPCAQIRLLRPLDHPVAGLGLVATIADAATAVRFHADVIVTQRHAVPSIAAADALAAHAERTGAILVYDLDDDLLTIPPAHPEAEYLAPKTAVVEHMIRRAGIVRTSTQTLAERVAPLARQVRVVGNALDERIWLARPRTAADRYGPVRILCMGTATHDGDFEILLPALDEIHRRFGDQITFDLIGFVARTDLPDWIRRVAPATHATRSYAGFVHWITSTGRWDIGLAPLADSPFNACKSAIKTLDFAALGLAVLASDVPAYRGSLADGTGGRLVPNTSTDWYEALSRLIRDVALRQQLAEGAGQYLRSFGTLASQAGQWRQAWPKPENKKRRSIA